MGDSNFEQVQLLATDPAALAGVPPKQPSQANFNETMNTLNFRSDMHDMRDLMKSLNAETSNLNASRSNFNLNRSIMYND